MLRPFLVFCGLMSLAALGWGGQAGHTFALRVNDFLLDGKPFQVRSGEMHPERTPAEYWRHRIQMTNALGLNTIVPFRAKDFKPCDIDLLGLSQSMS